MLNEIVNRRLITLEPHATVAEAARMMAENDVGSVLVLSHGKPRGILTDRDIVIRGLAANLDVNDTTIENILTESLETVRETEGLFDCIRKMKDAKVRRMPVVDEDGKAVGIISFGDILAFLSQEFAELTRTITPAQKIEARLKAA